MWVMPCPASTSIEPAVRDILGRELGRDPDTLRIARRCRICGDPLHGKPYVEDAPGFSYNVSHSGEIAVVAAAHGGEVGVDVEVLRTRRYLDRLAARILNPRELDAWQAAPEPERLAAFLGHWTAREAYLKGIGIGLRMPMRDALSGAEGWTIRALDGLDGAVATVAFEGTGRVRVVPYAPVP